MWWLEVRFSAAQSLPKNRIGGASRSSTEGSLSTPMCSAHPFPRRRERQAAVAGLLDQLGQSGDRVRLVVVQQHDVATFERVLTEPRTQVVGVVAGVILWVHVPQHDRLAAPPQ